MNPDKTLNFFLYTNKAYEQSKYVTWKQELA